MVRHERANFSNIFFSAGTVWVYDMHYGKQGHGLSAGVASFTPKLDLNPLGSTIQWVCNLTKPQPNADMFQTFWSLLRTFFCETYSLISHIFITYLVQPFKSAWSY
jgi:hypothetical protein